MKRLMSSALAAAMFAAPLAVAPEAAARDRDRYERRHDDDRHHRRQHRDYEREHDRWHRRNDRDHRRYHRDWDDRHYNGYYYNNHWYYGPPPARWRDHARYDYRHWRRGDRLPSYYRSRYVVVHDYDRYHLRRPPRGYHYVRDDRGDYLLIGIATGVILGIIASR
jgi:Ni/Co efflux regulator RcnB